MIFLCLVTDVFCVAYRNDEVIGTKGVKGWNRGLGDPLLPLAGKRSFAYIACACGGESRAGPGKISLVPRGG
jgi:hypothetical protein